MAENNQKEAEELLQQSSEQKRHNTPAGAGGEPDQETASLDEAVAEAYHALDDGDLHENLTVRDENLAALVAGLDDTERLEAVGVRANDHLGRDDDVETRAGLLKALLRVGLSEVAEEELTEAKDGRRMYLQETEMESEF